MSFGEKETKAVWWPSWDVLCQSIECWWKIAHGCWRKIGCVFSEKKLWGLEIYFVERKKWVILSKNYLFLNGKNEGQSMATDSWKRFAKKEHRKEFCV